MEKKANNKQIAKIPTVVKSKIQLSKSKSVTTYLLKDEPSESTIVWEKLKEKLQKSNSKKGFQFLDFSELKKEVFS